VWCGHFGWCICTLGEIGWLRRYLDAYMNLSCQSDTGRVGALRTCAYRCVVCEIDRALCPMWYMKNVQL